MRCGSERRTRRHPVVSAGSAGRASLTGHWRQRALLTGLLNPLNWKFKLKCSLYPKSFLKLVKEQVIGNHLE